MPTGSDDAKFADEMRKSVEMSSSALDYAISWIQKNLEPDDVFTDTQLENWAESNDYVKEG